MSIMRGVSESCNDDHTLTTMPLPACAIAGIDENATRSALVYCMVVHT
jgi:hypothetical protein